MLFDPYSTDENYLRWLIESSYPEHLQALNEPTSGDAGLYLPLHCSDTEYYVTIRRLLHTHLVPNAGSKLIDCGCGVGVLSFEAAAQGHSVTAIDSSGKLVAFCNSMRTSKVMQVEIPMIGHYGRKVRFVVPDSFRRGNVEFLVGDVLDLSCSNNSVDFVISSNVLDRVTDPQRAVAEMYRVLKPGGRLLISSPLDWRAIHTPDAAQWAQSIVELLCESRWKVLIEERDVDYRIRISDRFVEAYRCDVVIAERRNVTV